MVLVLKYWNVSVLLEYRWALKTVSHLMTLCSSGSRHGQVWHLPHRPRGQRPGGMLHSPTVPRVLSRARHRPPSRWCQWLRLWGSKPCRKYMVAPRAPLCWQINSTLSPTQLETGIGALITTNLMEKVLEGYDIIPYIILWLINEDQLT